MPKRPAHHVNYAKLEEGDYLSKCAYYKVKKIKTDCSTVVIENEDGFLLECTAAIPEQEMFSASQVVETKKVTRTELVDILMSAGNMIFTVEFHCQLDPADVAACLSENLSDVGEMPLPQRKKFCKEQLLQGRHRTLVGYLLSTEPTLGRSKVRDMAIPKGQFGERLVDHRTLKSIIIQGVKYELK